MIVIDRKAAKVHCAVGIHIQTDGEITRVVTDIRPNDPYPASAGSVIDHNAAVQIFFAVRISIRYSSQDVHDCGDIIQGYRTMGDNF